MFNLFSSKKAPAQSGPKITLYNTATSQPEIFKPLRDKHLLMYSCGPTVYDHAHIGNLRAYLLPDLLRRLFEHDGYTVKSTINFTDFGHLTDDADAGEDKMMKALKRHEKPVTLAAMKDVAQIYIDSFKSDLAAFGNKEPSAWTPASEYVHDQISLVKTLMEKGYAYETPDGVYFEVAMFPKYGILGNVDINKIKEGARIETNPHKRHPADFALWKKGLLGWESEWGKGFPGWHIECTAMAFATLGKQIDIHTGGEDLKYTHHNGELAQAEAITRKPYVGYWMHNAHLAIDGQKIAKSLGNGVLLRELVTKGYSPLDYRYLLLTAHYRAQMNFTWEALTGAKTARAKLSALATKYDDGIVHHNTLESVLANLRDDLATAGAIADIWKMMGDGTIADADKSATLRALDALLGILDTKKETTEAADLPTEITTLLEERKTARANKDFATSDRLRDELKQKGYIVLDTSEGQKVEVTNATQ